MNKILTAENLLNSKLYSKTLKKFLPKTYKAVNNIMIEFAKLHVEAALKQASGDVVNTIGDVEIKRRGIDKIILKSYSLKNIK